MREWVMGGLVDRYKDGRLHGWINKMGKMVDGKING